MNQKQPFGIYSLKVSDDAETSCAKTIKIHNDHCS